MASAIISVMARLNMTLDDDTYTALKRYAKKQGAPQATVARRLLAEALARKRAAELQRKLAADYAAEREGTEKLLAEMEGSQLDWFEDEIDE